MQLTENAINYAWQQLAERAGIVSEDSGIRKFNGLVQVLYTSDLDSIRCNSPTIVVVPCSPNAAHDLLHRESNSLEWRVAKDVFPTLVAPSNHEPIPVLFWGEAYENDTKPFVTRRSDGLVIFYADIIAATFFMLTRWEEIYIETRDQHGRFPATASSAYRQGFLHRPVIDEYALILRAWLCALVPTWEPRQRMFSVKLSHDIDFIRRFQGSRQVIQTLGIDIVKNHSLGDAWTSAKDAYCSYYNFTQNSYFQGIYQLAELTDRFGLDSTFYFLATETDPYKAGYAPEMPEIRSCMATLAKQGCELGFHAGYYTYDDEEKFYRELLRLAQVVPTKILGGRQHFLRFRIPYTWRQWANAHLCYDTTLGYADADGFRCGTCHPFFVFDTLRDEELSLWEVPLIVMDSTLHIYQKLTPMQGLERVLQLAKRCAQVEGTFTLLWHNSSLSGEWSGWAPVYVEMLQQLAEL